MDLLYVALPGVLLSASLQLIQSDVMRSILLPIQVFEEGDILL